MVRRCHGVWRGGCAPSFAAAAAAAVLVVVGVVVLPVALSTGATLPSNSLSRRLRLVGEWSPPLFFPWFRPAAFLSHNDQFLSHDDGVPVHPLSPSCQLFHSFYRPIHAGLTLDAIDLRIEPGQLVGVVGPVGSSKSSLLLALLKEIAPESSAGAAVAALNGAGLVKVGSLQDALGNELGEKGGQNIVSETAPFCALGRSPPPQLNLSTRSSRRAGAS